MFIVFLMRVKEQFPLQKFPSPVGVCLLKYVSQTLQRREFRTIKIITFIKNYQNITLFFFYYRHRISPILSNLTSTEFSSVDNERSPSVLKRFFSNTASINKVYGVYGVFHIHAD